MLRPLLHSQASSGAELERAEQWYSSRAGYDNRLDLAIVEQRTNSYVGEVVLNELDVDNRSCSFRIALVGPLYEQVGFVHDGTKRQALHWQGDWVDAHLMALLAEDWSAHRGHPKLSG
ncbi:GNAT family N-acetyltransferase [Salinispora cortesiana]|uniref:GNAT family N-acetyltransferase n=1 Tax=Salinispora cortesiana TaxID=1305843 RepID=UPI001FDEB4F0|nr:GNAT family protein [Salinispora cortesiana]